LLHNETYKRLREQDWLQFVSRDPNPSQTFHRIRTAVDRAFEEIGLLAEKPPDEKQELIFTVDKINNLISKILRMEHSLLHTLLPSSRVRKLDSRRVQISAGIIQDCVHFCQLQLQMLFPESESLIQPTIDQLNQTIRICNDIANKVELNELRNLGKDDNLEFLFNWDKVTTRDKYRLESFLYEETNLPFGVTQLKKSNNGKSITCKITDDNDTQVYYSVKIKINEGTSEKSNANLLLTDLDSNKVYTTSLVAKKKNETYYIFKKSNH